MKKLAIYSAMFVTLLAMTACENRNTTTTNPNQPSRDRTVTPPQNPNTPSNPDQTGG